MNFVLKKIVDDEQIEILYVGTLYFAQHHMQQEIIKYTSLPQFIMTYNLPGVECHFLAKRLFRKEQKIKLKIEE